jgi:hypothetical protein
MSATYTFTFRRRTLSVAALIAVLGIVFASADSCDSQQTEARQAENAAAGAGLSEIVRNQPPPVITHSQIRATLGEIEKAQADGVQTTSFFMHIGVPDPINTCPSIGMPVPNTASLTNPQQTVWASGGGATVGQMDPNGIYVPESSSGTYVLCIGPDGKAIATYWEGDVLTAAGPAVWDKAGHTVKQTGAPSFAFTGGTP